MSAREQKNLTSKRMQLRTGESKLDLYSSNFHHSQGDHDFLYVLEFGATHCWKQVWCTVFVLLRPSPGCPLIPGLVFMPSATKSGWPYGVMSASLLSCRTPPPLGGPLGGVWHYIRQYHVMVTTWWQGGARSFSQSQRILFGGATVSDWLPVLHAIGQFSEQWVKTLIG